MEVIPLLVVVSAAILSVFSVVTFMAAHNKIVSGHFREYLGWLALSFFLVGVTFLLTLYKDYIVVDIDGMFESAILILITTTELTIIISSFKLWKIIKLYGIEEK